ncbi:MAG TPA: fumarylacetoacetate hydrolase family protein [Microlunatus sp.]|nr:fumarylacetoacetate hydrolase family protein [Microlunatus sp.]
MTPTPLSQLLPTDRAHGLFVGRILPPEGDGPCVVAVRGDELADLTTIAPTMADLLERPSLRHLAERGQALRSWAIDDPGVRLLAPVDLQVIKAAGVTFAISMIERVIEERAAGDPTKALEIRQRVQAAIGRSISQVAPGSETAAKAKEALQAEGLWSQYLEVGIGPDPEIFTKAPVLSAVGAGARIGVLSRSAWNNPEPEVVLVARPDGTAVGATLGNDVNLRDFEGRSALLLGEAKDNNASAAIGPMIRLFDDTFTLDHVADADVTLTIEGADDGFRLEATSSMSQMSRTLPELLGHTRGAHHQYPDGFALFTGTMFAPTQDRDAVGMGFTHHEGDVVTISTPLLGSLINTVTSSEAAPPWEVGIRALYQNLAERRLIFSGTE